MEEEKYISVRAVNNQKVKLIKALITDGNEVTDLDVTIFDINTQIN